MSLVINHNMMAANVARNLNSHYANLARSTQRLSTGMRINSAADDAAGLAIRELQRADIAALQQGARNANDAVSLIQVADGALQIIDEKLIRMKELAEQAATGSYDSTQRLMIESEYQAMASEITRIAMATDFNGVHLLDGSLSGAHDGSGLNATGKMKIHFGTGNDSAEDYYYIEIGCATAAALGVGNAAFTDATQEFSTAYFEELRDASAQAAYDVTYKKKYAEYYEPIYNKLVNGTSEEAAVDAATASAKADEIASALAAAFAEDDRKMAAAAMDKVYNDNYMTPYLDAYQKHLDEGMTPAAAQAAADKDAAAKAMEAVKAANEAVVSASTTVPDVSVYTGVNALPPKNSLGAEALLDEARTLVYDAAYKNIYDSLYADAVNKALADSAIVGIDPASTTLAPISPASLTAAQVLAIHDAVDAQAADQAATIADSARNDLQNVYETTYGDNTPGTRYRTYYDAALDAGYPAPVAQKVAEEKASADAWDAVEAALRGGSFSLTGSDFTTSADISVPTALPTWKQMDTLMEITRAAVYDSIYSGVYADVFTQARGKAIANHSVVPGSMDLTETQRNEIKALAHTTADAVATGVSDQIMNAVQDVYDRAYATPGATEADAWKAVRTALVSAKGGTPFGINTSGPQADAGAGDGLNGHEIDVTQFDYNVPSMTITDANGSPYTLTLDISHTGSATEKSNAYTTAGNAAVAWMNTPIATSGSIPVSASKTGDDSDAASVSSAVTSNAATWLDTKHALNGGDPAMVAASKAFEDKYTADSTPALRAGGTVSTQEAAQEAITAINEAIVSKDKIRAHLGAIQNRLENTISNLNLQAENLQAAESRISDVDVATEMTEFTRQQILSQSAVAMLAQANSLPQMAMQLIGG